MACFVVLLIRKEVTNLPQIGGRRKICFYNSSLLFNWKQSCHDSEVSFLDLVFYFSFSFKLQASVAIEEEDDEG